jgi:hypothetical protein
VIYSQAPNPDGEINGIVYIELTDIGASTQPFTKFVQMEEGAGSTSTYPGISPRWRNSQEFFCGLLDGLGVSVLTPVWMHDIGLLIYR